MNHQISPWSIYDPQKQQTPSPKEHRPPLKRRASHFKSTSLTDSTQFQESEQSKQACTSIDKRLQTLLSLKIIHHALRQEQRSQLCLPLIHRCLILNDKMFKDKSFQSLSQSKESNKHLNPQNELREIDSLKKRKQNLSILYYEPFDEQQIVSRGIMQLLRIKERQLRMLSKHKIKSSKQ